MSRCVQLARLSGRSLETTVLLTPLQRSRIDKAHSRAREVLKFSSLVTDAYFHYTPSQIMLAALSIADEGLADMIIDDAFKPTGDGDGTGGEQPSDVRVKVARTIENCRTMLQTEPPERMAEYWGTVCIPTKTSAPVRRRARCELDRH